MDAIAFENGIAVWIDGELDLDSSVTGPGVFRIRDGYKVSAAYYSGFLVVSYESNLILGALGLKPSVLTIEEAEQGDLQLAPSQAAPVSLPKIL